MSHLNPYLLQISGWTYPQNGEYGYQGCIHLILDKICCIDNVRTRFVVYIFIRSFYVVNF
jgi:hypothetical protein